MDIPICYIWLLIMMMIITTRASSKTTAFDNGADLQIFVSEPSVRPPIFNVSYLDLDKVAPGYWFLASYSRISQPSVTSQLEVCQSGPHIFDTHGNLVWSGACDFHNSNVFDFKAWENGSSTQLSFILADRLDANSLRLNNPHSVGVVLNENFEERRIHALKSEPKEKDKKVRETSYNMHEFTVIDGGKRGLMFSTGSRIVDTPPPLSFPNDTAKVWDGALVELDMITGEPIFEWKPLDHISLSESSASRRHGAGVTKGWDWIHANSIDKDQNGDYLMSARFTDTIYKISGKDGSIIWRLGGNESSFTLDGFNFSRQHDARFRGQTESKTLISFLNNAGDGRVQSGNTSAGYLVELDTNSMTAKLIKQWLRPDGGQTRLRGNVQMLENNHVFISWSENGHITEYDPNGNVILDAQFASRRLATYRAYKFDFVGRPTYPPKVKSIAYNLCTQPLTSIAVSWNGATEIASWNFYGGSDNSTDDFTLIGALRKTGFETMLVISGYYPLVYAEALSATRQSLGLSNITSTSSEIPFACRDEGSAPIDAQLLGSEISAAEDQEYFGLQDQHIHRNICLLWDRSPGCEQSTNIIYFLLVGLALGMLASTLCTGIFFSFVRAELHGSLLDKV